MYLTWLSTKKGFGRMDEEVNKHPFKTITYFWKIFNKTSKRN